MNPEGLTAADAATQHWGAGVLLLVAGLVVATTVVARVHSTTADPRSGHAGDSGLKTLLGLLGAATLAVLGAGLLSTGELTLRGWGPFAVAGVLVLGPPAVSLLLHRRTSHRRASDRRARTCGDHD